MTFFVAALAANVSYRTNHSYLLADYRHSSTHQPVTGGVRRSRCDTYVGGGRRNLVILHKQPIGSVPGVSLDLELCYDHLKRVSTGEGVLTES